MKAFCFAETCEIGDLFIDKKFSWIQFNKTLKNPNWLDIKPHFWELT